MNRNEKSIEKRRKTMKKILCVLLAVVLIFCVTACGKTESAKPANTPSGSSSNAPVKDTLNIAISQDRGTLNPMYLFGYDILNALRMIYETMWDFDRDGNQIWCLATSLEKIEDKVYHITLREGVTFSNNNPLTASDVVFTLKKANNRVGEPEYLSELDLEKTKALSDYMVELVFKNYDMSYFTSMASLPIFDEESFDEQAITQTPIGTGPYKLDEYVVNSHLDMSVRDGYWGEKPAIPHLSFKVLAEDAQKTNALSTGSIDITAVPFQDIEYVKTLSGYSVDLLNNGQSRALFINTNVTSKFYDNVEARQAVAYGIDRQGIADIAYSGFAELSRLPVSMGNIAVTPDMLDYGVYGTGYDPVKAAELAESSGLKGQTIVLITNGGSDSVTCAELIKENMNEIGVNVEIKNYDAGSWLSYAFDPTSCDMLVDFTYVPSLTLAQNMSAWYQAALGGAYTNNPMPGQDRYNELCDGIMALSDANELHDRYVEMCRLETDAMLWFSLVDMQSATAYPAGLKGWKPLRMGNVDYSKLSW